MAMNLGSGASKDDEVLIDINTTPLIDVMLVLLIMLIVTIPIQLHSVNLDMPQARTQAPPVPPRTVAIDIDADGSVRWDGEVVVDREALDARFKTVSARADQAEVHVRPNKSVEYKRVALVLSAAQRAGVSKLGIVDGEQLAR